MPFPKKVIINSSDWNIIRASQEELDKQMPEDRPGTYRGLCCRDSGEIYIYNKLRKDHEARTLLHEMIHAMLTHLIHDEKEEEAIVLILEERMAGLFRDNPKVIDYLKETL